ncbi:hypothetical protein L198_04178 [Cryptococcus wingfieldii CBS 7118]|uniref:Zn(2)-C6 fungal-type domain-containing protein n=1 Tax=Cryptococcus wingfieldii CBS 7118 TaxID=1295528 RepID=A0A1E3J6I1_9TREE|nr:hypothetical protein L198_04178 [Cryptococcus wingfieldii CBS 7118]ODN96464.1 hypothetical protein L198_04178 [Cryptococcus wingfieldii CBS 7118]
MPKADTDPSKEGPVKAACLSCRQKKQKCDGKLPICTQCTNKHTECQYVKSRRGGARPRRKQPPKPLNDYLQRLDNLVFAPALHDFKHVVIPDTEASQDRVLHYGTPRLITLRPPSSLEKHYQEIHPYIPVMPPRKYLSQLESALLPQSPFLLAAQTILALVPHPNDPDPSSPISKQLREGASAAYSQQCLQLIDAMAASGQQHIECVQALIMLGVWEWSSSGSVERSRARHKQAIDMAFVLRLHETDRESYGYVAPDDFSWEKDRARRTWWGLYNSQIIASVVTGNIPLLNLDEEYYVHFPIVDSQVFSWAIYNGILRKCAKIFTVICSLYMPELSPTGVSPENSEALKQKLVKSEAELRNGLQQAELTEMVECRSGEEEEALRNLQLSARLALAVILIHIHRHQAFPEVSIFSRQVCGLPSFNDTPAATQEKPAAMPGTWPGAMDTSYSDQDQMQTGFTSGSVYDPEVSHAHISPYHSPPWSAGSLAQTTLFMPLDQTPSFGPSPPPLVGTGERSVSGASVASSVLPSPLQQHESPRPPQLDIFPPGTSLVQCATAAQTIVRLETYHRETMKALWNGQSPKWMPYCACGLVTGAYAFLLLALAAQAESEFSDEQNAQVQGLLEHVKTLLAGLDYYGIMWSGIKAMADDVRASLEAAQGLCASMEAEDINDPMAISLQ